MTQYDGYFSTCNTTKWEEQRRLALSIQPAARPRFRSRHMGTGHLSSWEDEWFYHFRDGGYADIEYVELEFNQAIDPLFAYRLKAIGLVGVQHGHSLRIFGYLPHGTRALPLKVLID
ncbi:MAG: DUF6678 family protein [Pseudomonadota bacterium]